MKLLLDRITFAFKNCGNEWLTGGDISRILAKHGCYDSEISIKRTINLNIDYKDTGNKSNLFQFIKLKNQKGNWFRKYRLIIGTQGLNMRTGIPLNKKEKETTLKHGKVRTAPTMSMTAISKSFYPTN